MISPTRLLAVDDDATNLEIITEIFADTYPVTTAASGEEAIEVVDRERPDIILLDVMMPGMDGYETCRRLRAMPNGHSIKIILVSAKAMVTDCLKGYEAGADDYVTKPFVHAELMAKVKVFERLCSMEELVEQRTATNDALQQALLRAEEATQAKDAFFANASHELRTPMTAVIGFTELLRERLADPDDVEMIGVVLANGQHLLRLVNDILDFAKVGSGDLQVEICRVSPYELVADVLRAMRVQADRKGLTLRAVYDTPLAESIATDPTRYRQILINLIGNAIKFTSTGSVELRLSMARNEDGVSLLSCEVSDTGVGMTAEALTRIFEPFAQADASTNRMFGGTGLGLSISRSLARALGGQLSASSEPGRGSTFHLSVATGMLEGIPLVTEAAHRQLRIDAGTVPHDGASPPQTRLSGRVLLAEDTAMNQRLVTHIVSHAGASVTVVDNGAKALVALEQGIQDGELYDLVLMDMQMPVMDGFEATMEMRARNIRTPVIALTAGATDDVRARALESGCSAFATKPIDRASLLAMMKRLMDQAP
ncbi:MAG: response regulator [Planctomycetes bacterium]|nr:response regulator [Planctomycetota bacterium]